MEQGRSKIVSVLRAWTSSSVHEKEEKTAKNGRSAQTVFGGHGA